MAYRIPNEADAAFADQAEPDAVDFDILVAAVKGDGVVAGCAVTAQGTPDMTVAVAIGGVRIGGTDVGVSAGNLTIGAAHGTNPRFDLIAVGLFSGKSVVAGTAAANAVFPGIPANSVILAAIYVPAADTDIDANQITDKRAFLPAVADHGALTGLGDDDHTQYRLESADHSHQSAGLQAGQLSHPLALTGLDFASAGHTGFAPSLHDNTHHSQRYIHSFQTVGDLYNVADVNVDAQADVVLASASISPNAASQIFLIPLSSSFNFRTGDTLFQAILDIWFDVDGTQRSAKFPLYIDTTLATRVPFTCPLIYRDFSDLSYWSSVKAGGVTYTINVKARRRPSADTAARFVTVSDKGFTMVFLTRDIP